jgi:hypothetical protein
VSATVVRRHHLDVFDLAVSVATFALEPQVRKLDMVINHA